MKIIRKYIFLFKFFYIVGCIRFLRGFESFFIFFNDKVVRDI